MKERIIVGGALLAGVLCPTVARACAMVDDDGAAFLRAPVTIAREAAIIVWDAKAQRQHFIRRAEFDTAKRSIGFLVPTPSVPQIAAVEDKAFNELAAFTAPRIEYRVQRVYKADAFLHVGGGCGAGGEEEAASAGNAAGAPVTVLSWQRVAGYEATVLDAVNTAALGRWLKSHGYVARPEVVAWLRPYVQKRWKITAFKIARNKQDEPLQSSAVRLSFGTAKPFYPYGEPQNKKAPPARGRTMQLFFVATQRMDGHMENSAAAWPGQVKYAAPLPSDATRFMRLLGLKARAEILWLTAFTDESARRGTRDVYFQPEKTQAMLLPPPLVELEKREILVPVDLLLGIFFVTIIWGVKKRQRRAAVHKALLARK